MLVLYSALVGVLTCLTRGYNGNLSEVHSPKRQKGIRKLIFQSQCFRCYVDFKEGLILVVAFAYVAVRLM